MSRQSIILLVVLVPSVILHEISHGWIALLFGDDTAKRAGRLSLNPIRHIDPLGTIIIPGILVLAGGTPFGWAKPVPVNPRQLRKPREQSLLVSLAGPATNLVLVAVCTALFFIVFNPGRPSTLEEVVVNAGVINIALAIFNMIPLPPLDGSAVIERFVPDRYLSGWFRFRQYSMGILLMVVLFLPDGFNFVIRPAIDAWASLLSALVT